jgi:hypothetical protein
VNTNTNTKSSAAFLILWAALGTLGVVGALSLGGVISRAWSWVWAPFALIVVAGLLVTILRSKGES